MREPERLAASRLFFHGGGDVLEAEQARLGDRGDSEVVRLGGARTFFQEEFDERNIQQRIHGVMQCGPAILVARVHVRAG